MDQFKIRGSSFRKIELIVPAVNQHSTTPLTINSAKLYLQRVRESWELLDNAHSQLIEQAATEAADETQELVRDKMFLVYNEVEIKLIEIIDSLTPAGSSAPTGVLPDVKLPPITLPTFSGGHENWLSFKDLFTASVDKRADLAPSQKLHYLKSSLQGDAATILKSISITDSNYIEAWRLLKARFDNEREIVHTLVSKLLDQRKIVTESSTDLRALVDNTNEYLSALKVLKRPTEHWNDLLVVITVSKLDDRTKREWAIRQTGTNLPTFQDLLTFLEGHIRGLQASGATTYATSKDKRRDTKKSVRVHHAATSSTSCGICSGRHFAFQCPDLLKLPTRERRNKVAQARLCYNSLWKDHSTKNCQSIKSCKRCGKRHHTLLHYDAAGTPQTATTTAPQQPTNSKAQHDQNSSSQISSHHVDAELQSALLMTAIVNIRDCNGILQPCRAFIDPGSTAQFISENCVTRLNLKRQASNVTVTGFGGTTGGGSNGQVTAAVHSRFQSTTSVSVNFHIMPKLTHFMPANSCKMRWWHLQGLPLADPSWYKPGPVDVLIGIKHYHDVMLKETRRGPPGSPTACNSIFGWILSGECPPSEQVVHSFHVSVSNELQVLQKFWEIEEPPKARILTKDEKECEKHFRDTHTRDEVGRFIVQIPFNNKKGQLGYSRQAAVR